MVKVVYVGADGVEHPREVSPGLTLMEAAVRSGVPGIDADCGGACSCGTCHVYVEPEWLAGLGPVSETEASMLEFAAAQQENSRLSCQITLLDEHDGLRVRLPLIQG